MLTEVRRITSSHPIVPVTFSDISHLGLNHDNLLALKVRNGFAEPDNLCGSSSGSVTVKLVDMGLLEITARICTNPASPRQVDTERKKFGAGDIGVTSDEHVHVGSWYFGVAGR